MESLEDDVKFTLHTLSKDKSDWWFPGVTDPRKAAAIGVQNSYLETVSNELLRKLRYVYKLDYDLFYSETNKR